MNAIEISPLIPYFSRRINSESLYRISPKKMAQAIDVSIDLGEEERNPTKAIPGYFAYGWRSAANRIIHANTLGVEYISLRFISSANRNNNIEAGLILFEETLQNILTSIGSVPVKMIVDPFGLALTEDGQWGVRDNNGNFDKEQTHNLLEKVGFILSRNHVHGVVTLGRLPEEVMLTKKGISKAGDYTKIYSFSQNSETSTAYVYLDTVGHNTGQKIMQGNVKEMDLWALLDIWHGTDVSVIKPMESFHLMSSLRYLIENETAREQFLNSPDVKDMAQKNAFVAKSLAEMNASPLELSLKCSRIKMAGYTVSGTTYMLALLAHEKGPEMARARMEEMWITALGVMDEQCECLIDRNVVKYLEGSVLA